MEAPPKINYRFKEKSLIKLPKVLTLYYGQHMTVKQVAKELEISPMTVSRLLDQYGKGLRQKNKAPLS